MYRRITNRVTAIVVTVLIVAATAVPAWAAPPADPNPTARITAIITNITNWVTGILIGIATLFLTVGGLRRMTAGGDPAEIEKSNSAFKNSLQGYALAVLAPVLLGIVKGWIGG
ncbi:pilin [Dactylosporangium sp. NPDC049525]|uniref:pilin n=1 Tax=Dactylosporangium sp. NPDC049525 TaxID=3154730 RepID=UPI0034452E1E